MTCYFILIRLNDYLGCDFFRFGWSYVLVFILFWRIRPDCSPFSFETEIFVAELEH